MRTHNATDARIDMAQIVDRSIDPNWVLLVGCEPWSMVEHAGAYLNIRPCPICGGGPLRRTHYCLGCDRTGLDGRVTFPGLGVDEAPDPEWSSEATVYDPGELAGGVGRKVKTRRGIPRARRAG